MNFKFKALSDRCLCSADCFLAYVMTDTRLQGEAQYCASPFFAAVFFCLRAKSCTKSRWGEVQSSLVTNFREFAKWGLFQVESQY